MEEPDKEKGDFFDQATARSLRELLSRSGGEDPGPPLRRSRGAGPKVAARPGKIEPKRGLFAVEATGSSL